MLLNKSLGYMSHVNANMKCYACSQWHVNNIFVVYMNSGRNTDMQTATEIILHYQWKCNINGNFLLLAYSNYI